MEFPEQIQFRTTDSLKSGYFYHVTLIHRCYRINEVDHYLKDLEIDFVGLFTSKNSFQHLNRPSSKQLAETSLFELMKIPGIKQFDVQELAEEQIQEIAQCPDRKSTASLALLKKLIQYFPEKLRTSQKGNEYSLVALKKEKLPEYIESPELGI